MKSKTIILFMLLTMFFLFSGVCFAFTPEGELQVLIPGYDAKITFQEIDDNKILVSAVDAENNPVKGLMPDDFKLQKAGIMANITAVEVLKTREDIPINYVLMVDNSMSMQERKAVQPLLSALDEFLKIVRPIDNVEVVVFDGKKQFLVDGHNLRLNTFKSNNISELKSFFLESFTTEMSKQTFLYEGILGSLQLISKMPEKSNKFLVVFTDGEDLNSEIKKEIIGPKAQGLKNFSAYAIDFMPSEAKDEFLNAFSEANEGKTWKATSAANLLPIFKNISTRLLHQYVVEYNFINPPQGSITVNPSTITIEELTIIDSSPLLSYVFFDTGQSRIPERYKLLKNQAEADTFDENSLRDTIAKYHNVLNILGKRFSENTEASIEIVGCISDRGEEKNNLALSQARAEQVRAYFRYIWNIAPDRINVSARKLPELPSTSSVEQGRLENQRVEIHSDFPQIFDSIKTTYTFEVADLNEINIHPDIQLGYDLKNWNLEIKGDGKLLKSIKGNGNDVLDYSFSLFEYGLSKIGTIDNISISATLTDITGQTFTTNTANTSIKYKKRMEQKAQKLEYKVIEKYALILFDYDSAEIKAQNATILDRVVKRIKDLPAAKVTILGQTDIIGKEDYNVLLSERRAKTVYQNVIDSDIPMPERIVFRGNGPYNPPYDNATAEGRSFNRTVTIAIEYETN
ncbi:MAG: OmpA family protein [Deltaproteobacteria bacterium]|uniref:OmpA family protein n=1 Tax=Desulfobacula sp. TaxID=2593537 RepID=UPI0019A9279F|nr:OmpA family protein [Candidatus Desulfobacula maris]MBL6995989.1 OmpA family protein [Desulfobacula sp.]